MRQILAQGSASFLEFPAKAIITPGQLLAVASDGGVESVDSNVTAPYLLKLVARENEIMGLGIRESGDPTAAPPTGERDTRYAIGDQVLAIVPHNGTQVNMLITLPGGDLTVERGEYLKSGAVGSLTPTAPGGAVSNQAIAIAMEDVTLAAAGRTYMRVIFT